MARGSAEGERDGACQSDAAARRHGAPRRCARGHGAERKWSAMRAVACVVLGVFPPPLWLALPPLPLCASACAHPLPFPPVQRRTTDTGAAVRGGVARCARGRHPAAMAGQLSDRRRRAQGCSAGGGTAAQWSRWPRRRCYCTSAPIDWTARTKRDGGSEQHPRPARATRQVQRGNAFHQPAVTARCPTALRTCGGREVREGWRWLRPRCAIGSDP